MYLTPILSVLLFQGLAYAAPAEEKQDNWFAAAYLTTEWDWGNGHTTGDREVLWSPGPGSCVNLEGTKFDKKVASFGPEPGIICFLHDRPNCEGQYEPEEKLWVIPPGYARLANLNWGNKARSFQCYYP